MPMIHRGEVGMSRLEPYALILFLGAVISACVGVSSWRRRATAPAARALAWIMLGLAEWSGIGAAGLVIGGVLGANIAVLGIYPGVAVAVVSFFWFCRVMAGHRARPSRRVRVLLAVEPVLLTVAAVTNGLHHLLIAEVLPADASGLPGAAFGP